MPFWITLVLAGCLWVAGLWEFRRRSDGRRLNLQQIRKILRQSGSIIPLLVAIAAATWLATSVLAQPISSSSLVIRVVPEAHLSPSQIPLMFIVSADGAVELTSQVANVLTWVRALPGEEIHLIARFGTMAGPSGTLPASAIAWHGSVLHATAGGQDATCTDGSMAAGLSQALVSGWQRSGTLACAVTFWLESPRSLAPGVYTVMVDLALYAA